MNRLRFRICFILYNIINLYAGGGGGGGGIDLKLINCRITHHVLIGQSVRLVNCYDVTCVLP